MRTLSIGNIYANRLWVGESDTPPVDPDIPTPTMHTVVFNGNGGSSEIQSVEVEHGSTLASLPSASREEYTFDGWFDQLEGGSQLTTSTQITEDKTYYAHWTIEEPVDPGQVERFTLTFDGNGNGQRETREVLYGDGHDGKIGTFPEFSMDGHGLAGWWTLPEGGQQVSESTVVDRDMTVYAHWTAAEYTVTFDAAGGDGGWSGQLPYGSAITVPVVTKTGHMFVGWEPSVDSTVPEGGATYTAQWRVNQYEVTFDAAGGEGGQKTMMDYGSEITAPGATREGYTLNGWVPAVDQTVPDHDVTYTAQWEANQYEMSFDANGGQGSASGRQTYGAETEIPVVTWEGHTLAGWEPEVPDAVPLGGGSYEAQWQTNQYTATFNANGGTGGTMQTLEYGDELNAPAVARNGYEPAGWSPAVPQTMPADNVTYTAQWTPAEYSVTYDLNGHGSPNPDNIQTYTIETGEYVPEDPLDAGDQTFNGWTPELIPAGSTGDVTFTANWEPVDPANRQYQVKFDDNGGTGGWTRMMKYGMSIAVPTVSREGYEHTGWSPEPDATVPDHNVTYVAQWRVNQYTLTFNDNGGSGGTSLTQNYGTAVVAPTVTRTGYTHTGWTPAVPATVPAHDGTYAATWQANRHVVTFNANGGTGGTRATKSYGARITPPTVKRTGYTFLGWNPGVPSTVPDHDVTFTAQWQVNQYTMTFDDNGGTGGATVTKDYGAALEAPTVTSPTYVFDHWEPSVPSTVPAENKTFTAQWRVNKYTVTFDDNGGTGGWSRSMDQGSTITVPTVSRTGYTFGGWQPTPPATVPAQNVRCVAQWNLENYPITYNMNGHGTANPQNLQTYTVETGAYSPLPPENVEGWTFASWTPPSIPAGNTGAFTFTAQWTQETSPDDPPPPDGWTRIWWTAPRDAEAERYTDVNIVGDLTQNDIEIEGHTKDQIIAVDIGTNVTCLKNIGTADYPLYDGAFYNCQNLTRITIPNSVQKIGSYAFYDCKNLTNFTIPNSVTEIEMCAFVACSSLTNMAIPNSVTELNYAIFRACTNLVNITIPNSVTRIGDGSFNATGLTSVTIPSSVTSIGTDAFLACKKLPNVTIPSNVTSIGEKAFYSCWGLTSISVEEGNPNYSSANGLLLSKDGTQIIQGVNGDVVIPSSVTSIGRETFAQCRALNSIVIPDSVVSIDYRAFEDCHELKNIVFGNGVTSIGDTAFYNCRGITEITMPNSVANIGNGAFSNCTEITRITFGNGIDHIGDAAFNGCRNCVIFDFRKSTSVPELANIGAFFGANTAFDSPTDRRIIVPDKLYSSWINAENWNSTRYYIRPSIVKASMSSLGFLKYQVTFDAAGGTGGWSEPKIYDDDIEAPEVTREGYVFNGWSPAVDAKVPDHDVTYTAQWTPETDRLTKVKYTEESGLPDWEGAIIGEIVGEIDIGRYTRQIPNVLYAKEIQFGNTITYIGDYAFQSIMNLTNVTIPNSVTHLGSYAFARCFLENVIIPDSVTKIETSFFSCGLLKTITFGKGLQLIDGFSFGSCIRCTIYDFRKAIFVPTLRNVSAFDNTPENKEIIVPDELYDEWVAADNWNSNTNNIRPSIVRASQSSLERIQFTVTFDDNGGIGGTSTLMEYGSSIVPPTVSKEGYTHIGWTPEVDQTVPDHDVTYTAQWTLAEYSITYNMNGYGVENPNNLSKYTIETGEYSPAAPAEVEGCTFNGWTPASIPAGNTGAFTFTATWISPESLTRVKYTEQSGLPDWSGYIAGDIVGNNQPIVIPTQQIPNSRDAKEIELGNAVTGIGNNSFDTCALTSIIMPDTVGFIGTHAFYKCHGLINVAIGDGVISIGQGAFCDCYYLENVTIGKRVTTIGISAFSSCSYLTSITIPDNVTSIANDAFYGCSSMTSVTIGDGLTTIRCATFSGCRALTNITFGSSLTNIETSAFAGCSSCLVFDFRKASQVPTLENVNAFGNTSSNKKIIVPDVLYDEWVATQNWSSDINQICSSIVKASQSSLGPLT